MLVTMAKIEMIGPKRYFDKAIALLQQLGTLHIEDLSKNPDQLPVQAMDMDSGQLESRNNLRNLLTSLNGVINILEPLAASADIKEDKELWEKDNSYLSEKAREVLSKTEEKTRDLTNKKSKLQQELDSLTRYEQVLKKVYPLAKKVITLEDAETVAFLLEGDYKETINAVNEEIGKITDGNFELISNAIDDNTTAAIIVFNKKYSSKVHKYLKIEINEIDVPSDLKDLSIDKVLAEISAKQETYPAQIAKADAQLKPLADKWFAHLKSTSNAIANRVDQIESIPNFAQTDYTFVLQAWLPYKELANLRKTIKSEWSQKIVVRQLELSQHDMEDAPIAISNPAWAKPYQFFTTIFQPPKYGTLDPTIFLAIFFPIFFGFIVGDIGYGLVVLTTVTLLRFKFMKQRGDVIDGTTRIFQYAAISTIFFGVIYLEFFGTVIERILGHHGIEQITRHIGPFTWPYLRDPEIENRLMEFLYISLFIGVFHLIVSYTMGIINSRREHAYKHMWEKAGMLGFLVAVAVMGAAWIIRGAIGAGPETIPMVLVAVVSAGLAVYGGGPMVMMEVVTGTAGNIASYLRLMSLGFAGAILAGVANDFAAGSIIGIFMAIFLHVVNVVVHTISPAIHSFRLNLLEGFNKFYEEGGREYKPFAARR